jgi:hypothetical protein
MEFLVAGILAREEIQESDNVDNDARNGMMCDTFHP